MKHIFFIRNKSFEKDKPNITTTNVFVGGGGVGDDMSIKSFRAGLL